MVPWPAVVIIYLRIAKYSQENFCGTFKSHENYKNLAQQIFSRLQYINLFLMTF